jgi:hypothetical protein
MRIGGVELGGVASALLIHCEIEGGEILLGPACPASLLPPAGAEGISWGRGWGLSS